MGRVFCSMIMYWQCCKMAMLGMHMHKVSNIPFTKTHFAVQLLSWLLLGWLGSLSTGRRGKNDLMPLENP